jgi:hypothetical protein
MPEVQVKGRVGADEASTFRQRDPGFSEEHEPLVVGQDAERFGLPAQSHDIR